MANEESLYRRIPNRPEFVKTNNGKLQLSTSAFNDPGCKPSVDRAILRKSPAETQQDLTDGVYCIIASDIRKISTVKNEGSTEIEPRFYYIDVVPRPVLALNDNNLPENLAHAQIESNPQLKTTSRFKKVKEALAIVANEKGYWVIKLP